MKTCGRCNLTKPLDNFGDKRTAKDGKNTYCKACRTVFCKESMERNQHRPCSVCKEKPRMHKQTRCFECHRLSVKASTYGITIEEAREMSQRPCAACGRHEHEIGGKHPMAIDHCHGTGRVRDVLCRYCNAALGMLLDDPIRIEQLKQYAIIQAQKHHETTTASSN